MNFADLYRFANTALSDRNVGFRALCDEIISKHPRVGGVDLARVSNDSGVLIGYMYYEEERSSPYDGPFDVAVIRFHESLNRCWRRFVCTKELMHVFDEHSSRTDNQTKFSTLLRELETSPLRKDESDMIKSERAAVWMAILVLFPERLRRELITEENLSPEDISRIAHIVKLPIQAVRAVSTPYYFTALEALTGDIA